MKRAIYIVLAWMAVLTACEREIPYKGEYQDPKLVIQTELSEGGKTVDCIVTRSAFFLDRPTGGPIWYPSEGVVFTVERENGEKISMSDSVLTTNNHVFHVPLATPLQAGETVTVRASHPDYPEAYGSDGIVPMPEVEVVSCVWDSTYDRCRVRLKFGENAAFDGVMGVKAKMDYNMVIRRNGTITNVPYYSSYIVSTDIAFMGMDNANSSEEGFNSFSELFFKSTDVRNKEVEFFIQATYRSKPPSQIAKPLEADISIISHSSDSYLYWRSIYKYFRASGNSDYDFSSMVSDMFGVEEVVQIYSNVHDGYGAVLGTSKKSITFTFKDNRTQSW